MWRKDFTEQENLVSDCLDELGIRYEQQAVIDRFTVDFVLENSIILEADGIFGHYKKSDQKRDNILLKYIDKIIHIKEKTKEKIKQEILDNL